MAAKERFIYSASAVGVGANFTGPGALSQSYAACSLPFVGGRAFVSEAGPGGNQVISFARAETEITGHQSGSTIVSKARTTVTGLDILNRVTAERVEVELTFTFDAKSKKLAAVAVNPDPYTNLFIDGVNYSGVGLDVDLADEAGKDNAKFRKVDLPARRKDKYHETKNGKVFTSLAKNDPRLKWTPEEYAYLDVSGLGRVCFAEWIEADEWQALTGLRIELNETRSGEIVIADPIGNGQFFP